MSNTINNGIFKGLGALGKLNIICDVDEVVALQTPKWCESIYNKLKDNKRVNEELIINELLLDGDFVLRRTEYYFYKWLKREEIDEVSKYSKDKLLEVYTEDGNFYDKYLLTNLGAALPGLISSGVVEKIYYVSKGEKNPAWDSKLKFIDDFLYVNGKTEILRVPLDSTKDEYVEKYLPYDKINVLIEDQPKNIYELLDGCLKNNEMTVMSPLYGYTIQNDITEEKLEEYYKNYKQIKMYYNNRE